MYACMQCGRKFKTTKAAERAMDTGCPGCGASDVDLYVKGRSPEPMKAPAPVKTEGAGWRGVRYVLRETGSGFRTTRPETLDKAREECAAANAGRALATQAWTVEEA